MSIQFKKFIKISGKIKCLTGLHIGASKDVMEIGGIDNPIIRDPLTDMPYIPGSSLKGKLRSLLEMEIDGKLNSKGKIHSCTEADCQICTVFGSSVEDAGDRGPTRLIVRDAFLTDNSKEKLGSLREKGLNCTEEKFENVINRLTSRAEHPRQTERVPAGTNFEFEMIYKVFERNGDGGASDIKMFKWLLQGLYMMGFDALGGSGSRGYGKIQFFNIDNTPDSVDVENLNDDKGKTEVIELKDLYKELTANK